MEILVSIANGILGIVALAVFFAILVGVYYMNQNEKGGKK